MRQITSARALILIVGLGLGFNAHAGKEEERIMARLSKLERALDNRGLIDLLQQVERLNEEVQRLNGRLEEQSYTIDQLRKTQRDTYVDVDQRLQNVERGRAAPLMNGDGVAVAPPLTTLLPGTPETIAGTDAPTTLSDGADGNTITAPPAQVPTPIATLDGPPDAPTLAPPSNIESRQSIISRGPTVDNEASETAYRDAFGLLKAGQYDESITAFREFLGRYPDSQYADNAQYWLGETHYVKREFEPALLEYRKLIEAYPQSKKQSHAMLKIGYSYHELGQLDQARAVLEDLRTRFSGTAAARLAEERIQILARASQ